MNPGGPMNGGDFAPSLQHDQPASHNLPRSHIHPHSAQSNNNNSQNTYNTTDYTETLDSHASPIAYSTAYSENPLHHPHLAPNLPYNPQSQPPHFSTNNATSMGDKINKLEQRVATLTQQLTALAGENQAVRDERDNYLLHYNNNAQLYNELMVEYTRVSDQLTQLLNNPLVDQEARITELEQLVTEQKQILEREQQSVATRDAEIQRLTDLSTQQHATIDALNNGSADLNNLLNENQSELTRLREELAQKGAIIAELTQKAANVDQLVQELAEKDQIAAQNESRISTLCNDLHQRDARIIDLQQALEDAEQHHQAILEENGSLQQLNVQLQQQLLEQSLAPPLSASSTDHSELQKQYDSLVDQFDASVVTYNALLTFSHQQSEQIQALTEQNQVLSQTAQLATTQHEKEVEHTEELEEKSSEIDDLQRDYNELLNKNELMAVEIKASQEQVEKLVLEVNEKQQQLEQQTVLNQQLQNQLYQQQSVLPFTVPTFDVSASQSSIQQPEPQEQPQQPEQVAHFHDSTNDDNGFTFDFSGDNDDITFDPFTVGPVDTLALSSHVETTSQHSTHSPEPQQLPVEAFTAPIDTAIVEQQLDEANQRYDTLMDEFTSLHQQASAYQDQYTLLLEQYNIVTAQLEEKQAKLDELTTQASLSTVAVMDVNAPDLNIMIANNSNKPNDPLNTSRTLFDEYYNNLDNDEPLFYSNNSSPSKQAAHLSQKISLSPQNDDFDFGFGSSDEVINTQQSDDTFIFPQENEFGFDVTQTPGNISNNQDPGLNAPAHQQPVDLEAVSLLQGQVDALSDQLTFVTTAKISLESQLEEIKLTNTHLLSQLSELQQTAAAAEISRSVENDGKSCETSPETAETLAQLQIANEQLNAYLENTTAQYNELLGQAQSQQTMITELSEKLAAIDSVAQSNDTTTFSGEIASSEVLLERIEQLNAQLADHQTAYNEALERYNELLTTAQEYQQHILDLEARIVEISANPPQNVEGARNVSTSDAQQLAEALEQVQQLSSQIQELTEHNESIQQQYQELYQQAQEQQTEYYQMYEVYQQCTELLNAQQQQNSDLLNKTGDADAALQVVENDLMNANSKLIVLQHELNELNEKHQRLLVELEDCTAQHTQQYNTLLESSTTQIEQITEQYNTLLQAYNDLSTSYQAVKDVPEQYSTLLQQYDTIKDIPEQYNALLSQYNELLNIQEQYHKLLKEYQEVKAIKDQYTELSQEHAQLQQVEAQYISLQEQYSIVSNTIEKYNELVNSYNDLEQLNAIQQTRIDELSKQTEHLKQFESLQDLPAKCDALYQELEQVRPIVENYTEMTKQYESIKDIPDQYNSLLQQYTALSDIGEQYNALSIQHERLLSTAKSQDDYNMLEERYQELVAQYNLAIAESTTSKGELTARYDSIRAEYLAVVRDFEHSKSRFDELQTEYHSLEQKYGSEMLNLNNDLAHIKQQYSSQTHLIAQYKADIEQLRAQSQNVTKSTSVAVDVVQVQMTKVPSPQHLSSVGVTPKLVDLDQTTDTADFFSTIFGEESNNQDDDHVNTSLHVIYNEMNATSPQSGLDFNQFQTSPFGESVNISQSSEPQNAPNSLSYNPHELSTMDFMGGMFEQTINAEDHPQTPEHQQQSPFNADGFMDNLFGNKSDDTPQSQQSEEQKPQFDPNNANDDDVERPILDSSSFGYIVDSNNDNSQEEQQQLDAQMEMPPLLSDFVQQNHQPRQLPQNDIIPLPVINTPCNDEKIAELTEKIVQLERSNAELSQQLHDKQSQLDQFTSISLELAQKTEELTTLQQKMSALQKSETELRDTLTQLQSEHATINENYTIAADNASTLQALNDNLTEQYNALYLQATEQQQQYFVLNEQYQLLLAQQSQSEQSTPSISDASLQEKNNGDFDEFFGDFNDSNPPEITAAESTTLLSSSTPSSDLIEIKLQLQRLENENAQLTEQLNSMVDQYNTLTQSANEMSDNATAQIEQLGTEKNLLEQTYTATVETYNALLAAHKDLSAKVAELEHQSVVTQTAKLQENARNTSNIEPSIEQVSAIEHTPLQCGRCAELFNALTAHIDVVKSYDATVISPHNANIDSIKNQIAALITNYIDSNTFITSKTVKTKKPPTITAVAPISKPIDDEHSYLDEILLGAPTKSSTTTPTQTQSLCTKVCLDCMTLQQQLSMLQLENVLAQAQTTSNTAIGVKDFTHQNIQQYLSTQNNYNAQYTHYYNIVNNIHPEQLNEDGEEISQAEPETYTEEQIQQATETLQSLEQEMTEYYSTTPQLDQNSVLFVLQCLDFSVQQYTQSVDVAVEETNAQLEQLRQEYAVQEEAMNAEDHDLSQYCPNHIAFQERFPAYYSMLISESAVAAVETPQITEVVEKPSVVSEEIDEEHVVPANIPAFDITALDDIIIPIQAPIIAPEITEIIEKYRGDELLIFPDQSINTNIASPVADSIVPTTLSTPITVHSTEQNENSEDAQNRLAFEQITEQYNTVLEHYNAALESITALEQQYQQQQLEIQDAYNQLLVAYNELVSAHQNCDSSSPATEASPSSSLTAAGDGVQTSTTIPVSITTSEAYYATLIELSSYKQLNQLKTQLLTQLQTFIQNYSTTLIPQLQSALSTTTSSPTSSTSINTHFATLLADYQRLYKSHQDLTQAEIVRKKAEEQRKKEERLKREQAEQELIEKQKNQPAPGLMGLLGRKAKFDALAPGLTSNSGKWNEAKQRYVFDHDDDGTDEEEEGGLPPALFTSPDQYAAVLHTLQSSSSQTIDWTKLNEAMTSIGGLQDDMKQYIQLICNVRLPHKDELYAAFATVTSQPNDNVDNDVLSESITFDASIYAQIDPAMNHVVTQLIGAAQPTLSINSNSNIEQALPASASVTSSTPSASKPRGKKKQNPEDLDALYNSLSQIAGLSEQPIQPQGRRSRQPTPAPAVAESPASSIDSPSSIFDNTTPKPITTFTPFIPTTAPITESPASSHVHNGIVSDEHILAQLEQLQQEANSKDSQNISLKANIVQYEAEMSQLSEKIVLLQQEIDTLRQNSHCGPSTDNAPYNVELITQFENYGKELQHYIEFMSQTLVTSVNNNTTLLQQLQPIMTAKIEEMSSEAAAQKQAELAENPDAPQRVDEHGNLIFTLHEQCAYLTQNVQQYATVSQQYEQYTVEFNNAYQEAMANAQRHFDYGQELGKSYSALQSENATLQAALETMRLNQKNNHNTPSPTPSQDGLDEEKLKSIVQQKPQLLDVMHKLLGDIGRIDMSQRNINQPLPKNHHISNSIEESTLRSRGNNRAPKLDLDATYNGTSSDDEREELYSRGSAASLASTSTPRRMLESVDGDEDYDSAFDGKYHLNEGESIKIANNNGKDISQVIALLQDTITELLERCQLAEQQLSILNLSGIDVQSILATTQQQQQQIMMNAGMGNQLMEISTSTALVPSDGIPHYAVVPVHNKNELNVVIACSKLFLTTFAGILASVIGASLVAGGPTL